MLFKHVVVEIVEISQLECVTVFTFHLCYYCLQTYHLSWDFHSDMFLLCLQKAPEEGDLY